MTVTNLLAYSHCSVNYGCKNIYSIGPMIQLFKDVSAIVVPKYNFYSDQNAQGKACHPANIYHSG